MKYVTVFTTLALLCPTLTTAITSFILSIFKDHRIPIGYIAVCQVDNVKRQYTRDDAIHAAKSAKRQIEGAFRNSKELESILSSRHGFPSIYRVQVEGYEAPFMMFPIGRDLVYKGQGLHETNINWSDNGIDFVDLVVLDKHFKVAQILNPEFSEYCTITKSEQSGSDRPTVHRLGRLVHSLS